MLVLPWDATSGPDEWRAWLATAVPFGQLVVNNLDRDEPPLVVPTHAVLDADQLLVHLARPNPVWPHLEAAAKVRYSVIGDYAYVPGTWRARAGVPQTHGVPTSYYTAVQFTCTPAIVDDAEGKAELLRAQLRHTQPAGDHGTVAADQPPYGHMLSAIRGLRLQILEVVAKFKYDDDKPLDHRERVSSRLTERGLPHDAGAATQQRRRMAERGEWSVG